MVAEKNGHDGVARRARVVRDDAVLLVDVALQLADDTVGVDGHLVGVEERRPLCEPRVLDLGDLGRHLALPLAAVLAELGLDLLDQHLDREPGVARQPHLHAVVLVDVLDALGVVDHDLAVRDRLPVAGAGEARAQSHEDVTLLDPRARVPARGPAARAEGQRMALVEARLARHGAVHGNVQELGELAELGAGPGQERSHARLDQGLLGRQEQPDGLAHGAGAGRLGMALGRLVRKRCGRHFLRADVVGHLDDDGTGPTVAETMEGTAQDGGHHVGLPDDLCRHRHGLVGADG
jgi:hypothetical protein